MKKGSGNKLLILLIFILGLSFSQTSMARGRFGLGAMLGVPLGISGLYQLESANAVDFLVAFPGGKEAIHLHADYLWINKNAVRIENDVLDAYIGVGLKFVTAKYGDENEVGIRIPMALNTFLQSAPVEFALEIAPVLDVIEHTDLELEAGLIVRYYFN